MADNVIVTPGVGATIAADEVVDGTLGTVKVGYVKIMDGTIDGTTKATVGANGLEVNVKAAVITSGVITTVGAVTAISNALPAGNNNIGDVDVASLPALPAGNNNIGDVDIASIAAGNNNIGDVDVASVTGNVTVVQATGTNLHSVVDSGTVTTVSAVTAITNALPAGTNLLGVVVGGLSTSVIYNGTTALTPKFAIIDAATSGDNTIVGTVGGKKIRVLSLFMVAAGSVITRFESTAGGTALTGQMNLTTNSGYVLPFNPTGWFETVSGELLNLELSAAISVDGSVSYVEV